MADNDLKPKKKGKLKWFLLIFFLLLLLGGGAGAWYYFFSDLPGSRQGTQSLGDIIAPKTVKTPPAPDLLTTMLDTFLVNLADPLGKRYIKVTFEVETVGPEVSEELIKQKAKIRDSIIMLLSSKTYADLMPAEAKLELKNEVTSRLNQILGGPKVTRVFITEMVIQ